MQLASSRALEAELDEAELDEDELDEELSDEELEEEADEELSDELEADGVGVGEAVLALAVDDEESSDFN